MINLNLEDNNTIRIKNWFSELTLSEFDSVVNLLIKNSGVLDWLKMLELLSDRPFDFSELKVSTYIDLLTNFLNEDLDNYPLILSYNGKKIKLKDDKLNLKSKQIVHIEGILKSDKITDKTAMILTILFCDEYKEDFFRSIKDENVGQFIKLINLINPVDVKIII